MSSQELTAELLERRKALLADITALRALFQEKLRAGNTVDIKRVGTLLKGYESIYWHMLLAQGRLEASAPDIETEAIDETLRHLNEEIKRLRESRAEIEVVEP